MNSWCTAAAATRWKTSQVCSCIIKASFSRCLRGPKTTFGPFSAAFCVIPGITTSSSFSRDLSRKGNFRRGVWPSGRLMILKVPVIFSPRRGAGKNSPLIPVVVRNCCLGSNATFAEVSFLGASRAVAAQGHLVRSNAGSSECPQKKGGQDIGSCLGPKARAVFESLGNTLTPHWRNGRDSNPQPLP